MANEIYNVTWWGDAPWTARSLQLGYEDGVLLGGQLEMQNRVEADGGVQESTFCASLKINELANKLI